MLRLKSDQYVKVEVNHSVVCSYLSFFLIFNIPLSVGLKYEISSNDGSRIRRGDLVLNYI